MKQNEELFCHLIYSSRVMHFIIQGAITTMQSWLVPSIHSRSLNGCYSVIWNAFLTASPSKFDAIRITYMYMCEPAHKIMVLFVLRKLILQTRMPVGLDVWCVVGPWSYNRDGSYLTFMVGPFVYFHTSCVRTANALARLRGCAGSPEPSLVAYVISTIISGAGSYPKRIYGGVGNGCVNGICFLFYIKDTFNGLWRRLIYSIENLYPGIVNFLQRRVKYRKSVTRFFRVFMAHRTFMA